MVTLNPTDRASVGTDATFAAYGLGGVSCSSVSLCFAFDYGGNLYVSTDPTGGSAAWTVAYFDTTGAGYGVTGVACLPTSSCVAVDGGGNVLLGSPPPTATQVKALLHWQLPSGHAVRIAALLRHGGYSLSFKAPTAGHLVLSWYLVSKGVRVAAGKRKPVLIGTANASFAGAGTMKIKFKLTRRGRQLLRGAKRLELTAEGRFTPMGQPAITALRTFTLRR